MNIQLAQVNIHNLRSIKEATVQLKSSSVLFGMNDSGKSNFLLALRLSLGNGSIDEKDVFCSLESPYKTEKAVSIDLKFIPVGEDGQQTDTFNELWGLHLGENIATDDEDKEFFAFRTEFTYDPDKEEYVRDRMVINEWRGNEIVVGSSLKYKTLSAFEFVYLDAHRDMSSDIRDKSSIWNKHISKLKMSKKAKTEIESSLWALGDRIIEESTFLQQVSRDLASAINTRNSSIEVSPITRSVDELYKGLDIYITQNDSSPIPIANLGLGTRSRAVFASLKTIVNKRINDARESPYFCLIAFEEPEAHIHPHSQRGLVKDFLEIQGQRIITTHSPYILSSSNLNDLIYVRLQKAETRFSSLFSLRLNNEAVRHIERFVLNTRGELLFANIVVLVEGETEEQALQIFFKEFFGYEPYELGVSFIGVGGKNYLPFLRVLESMGTNWYIFSDGEAAAINDLKSAMQQLNNLPDKPDLNQFDNIIVLDDSHDFETYLLDAGYAGEIISAINEYEGVENEEHQEPYFDYFIQQHHGKPMKPRSTDKLCEVCGETIKERRLRDYLSPGGLERAICDCMKSGKTKYAVPIAKKICSDCKDERRFPPKVKTLLDKIKNEGIAL
jgi:putative ATP-dependent endonuclease of OLD family